VKAVFLLGPTASGKTAVALALAERFPVEIVSVDSAQVYRGMDVGTAKPGAAERARVPHHLVDIIDPTSAYSAGRFREAALRLVPEISGRGRLPLLVGGTMLYYKALREGLDDMPAHLKASILGSSLNIPISNGQPRLGTWQGIYLCEHRDSGGSRRVVVTLQGQ